MALIFIKSGEAKRVTKKSHQGVTNPRRDLCARGMATMKNFVADMKMTLRTIWRRFVWLSASSSAWNNVFIIDAIFSHFLIKNFYGSGLDGLMWIDCSPKDETVENETASVSVSTKMSQIELNWTRRRRREVMDFYWIIRDDYDGKNVNELLGIERGVVRIAKDSRFRVD
jgi:hypothetical protein